MASLLWSTSYHQGNLAMSERKHSFYEMCSLRFSGQPEKFFLGRFFGDRSCFLERVIENVVDGQNKTAFRNWSWEQKAVGGNAGLGSRKADAPVQDWEVVAWQNLTELDRTARNSRVSRHSRGQLARTCIVHYRERVKIFYWNYKVTIKGLKKS